MSKLEKYTTPEKSYVSAAKNTLSKQSEICIFIVTSGLLWTLLNAGQSYNSIAKATKRNYRTFDNYDVRNFVVGTRCRDVDGSW